MNIVKRVCVACQKEFEVDISKAGKHKQFFCTRKCNARFIKIKCRKPVTHAIQCLNCNKDIPFGDDPTGTYYTKKYCSSKCKDAYRKKMGRKTKQKYSAEYRRKEWEKTKANAEKFEKHRLQSKIDKSKVRQWLIDYKLSKGCVDCGYNEHFSALQLDHEGFKSIAISDARSSIERLKREIEEGKCVVRCANCHSIVTWKRKVGLA